MILNLQPTMDILKERAEEIIKETSKSKTNADRIRSMSDEELAEHFSGLIRDTYEHEYCNSENDWLIWLQSEVEE